MREDQKRLSLDQDLDTTMNSQSKRDQEVEELIKHQDLLKGDQVRVTMLLQDHTNPREFNHSIRIPKVSKSCLRVERCHLLSEIIQVLALTLVLTHLHNMLVFQILEEILAVLIQHMST